MTEHHTFRKTGGTTGVEHAQQRIAATASVLNGRILGDQRFVVEHAWGCFPLTGIDHQAQAFCRTGNLVGHWQESIVND
ncbi:hypothetical protein D3C76_1772590 [compost metagenome]